MEFPFLDARPVLVAVAGPNGAGKTTFYEVHLRAAGLPFVNADVISRQLEMEAYAAADYADALRRELVKRRESFVFETVFSDPVGDKLAFLKQAGQSGFTVALCFIGLSDARRSEERVAMRVSQGGHNVPREKLESRFPRILANLREAIRQLPHVLIYDNDDLANPYRLVAVFQDGASVALNEPTPDWLATILD